VLITVEIVEISCSCTEILQNLWQKLTKDSNNALCKKNHNSFFNFVKSQNIPTSENNLIKIKGEINYLHSKSSKIAFAHF
jgi:hypothetical protein